MRVACRQLKEEQQQYKRQKVADSRERPAVSACRCHQGNSSYGGGGVRQ